MFFNKILKPFEVNEINAAGQFIKIMNCESALRVKAYSEGRDVFDTEVRAGFDVQTTQQFDKLVLTSETEQKLEIWVSKHKLSYDALSTKASRSSSFLVEHFGQSQQLLPYDPAQAKALISLSGKPFYVGGEGVNAENGIFVDIGEKYSHDSASPLYAYINDPVVYKALTDQPPVFHSLTGSISGHIYDNYYVSYINGKIYSFRTDTDSKIIDVETNVSTNVLRDGDYGNFKSQACEGWDGVWALRVAGSNQIKLGRIGLDNGLSENLVIDITGEQNTDIRAFCIAGDYAICAALRGVNGHDFYIIDKQGNYTIKNVPSQFGEVPYNLQYDPITNQVWLVADGGIYTCAPDLENWQRFTSKQNAYYYQMQFSQSFVAFNSSAGAKVYKRDGTEVLAATAKEGAFLGGDSQILMLSGDKVLESVNGGTSFNTVYQHPANFRNQQGGSIAFEFDGNVYFEVNEDYPSNVPALMSFPSGLDYSDPKAKFRVFKESY